MTDPIVVPVEADRKVRVGTGDDYAEVSVTPDEWVAAHLEPGDRVWVEIMPFRSGALNFGSPPRSFLGVVRRSWFYDGVVLDVLDLSDIDDPEKVAVFCHRDRIWPERGVVAERPVYTPVADWLAERRVR